MSNIIDIYNASSDKEKQALSSSLNSSVKVSMKADSTVYDDEWLVKMEETLKYLDNILRNPNRFIINEEEIVKIEKARRITVDSIKHLSKNTNFIQKFDPKTGEVKPSKILNINKEETFNTYENRFIHTLINNMKIYIDRKKGEQVTDNVSSDDVGINYHGSSNHNKQNIECSVNFTVKSKNSNRQTNNIMERIAKVEEGINNLCHNDVYKSIDKLHIMPVTSPIKKTNLILKNVNFQYALDLWNYLQTHMECSTKQDKTNKQYEEHGELKRLMDETFVLDYLIVQTLKDKTEEVDTSEIQGKVVNNTINQLLNLKEDLTVEQLQQLIGDEFVKVKYKRVADTSILEKIYKQAISEYMEKSHDLRVKKDGNGKKDIK